MLFMYGQNGIVGFTCNNINYYYRKNLLGDIVAIYNEAGTKLCEYAYDAWGNCTILCDTNGIGALNPFRYRGYYWDSELNLYYLNARYYDPVICRFISQDSLKFIAPEVLNGLNLFAYCLNNPVMETDPDGTDAIYVTLYDLNNNGLLIVGHAVLLIEDANGEWWFTQYTTDAFDWTDTLLECKLLNEMGYENLDNYLDSIKPKPGIEWLLQFVNCAGAKTIRYEGDYTASLALAQKICSIENGFGDYNLFTNNCLHYVKILLNEQYPIESKHFSAVEKYTHNSYEIVPFFFWVGSEIHSGIDKIVKFICGLSNLSCV